MSAILLQEVSVRHRNKLQPLLRPEMKYDVDCITLSQLHLNFASYVQLPIFSIREDALSLHITEQDNAGCHPLCYQPRSSDWSERSVKYSQLF